MCGVSGANDLGPLTLQHGREEISKVHEDALRSSDRRLGRLTSPQYQYTVVKSEVESSRMMMMAKAQFKLQEKGSFPLDSYASKKNTTTAAFGLDRENLDTRALSLQFASVCHHQLQVPAYQVQVLNGQPTMQKLFSTFLLLVLAPIAVLAQNKYPIVLVHGLSGWGRDELLGLKYWGGIQGDLQEQLKAQGYTVYTAAVGPFSSNWDRACELYAQIKGGQVDYGVKHSATHGHTRKGRTFAGLYPEWGNVVNGKVNKIHLIGHSMGGQTIRMLAQLLANGTTGSPTGTEDPTLNSLFAGGKDWVHSITTISTPNQGATLADALSEIGDTVVGLVVGTLSALNIGGSITEVVYDTKLDQWGITPKGAKETLKAYLERVFASKIFAPGFKDVSLWSLSVPGAKEESTWVKTLPSVYYYSYSTLDTHGALDFLLRPIHVPNVFTMFPIFQPIGLFLGSRWTPDNGYGAGWQPNDGVVPLESQYRDFTGALVAFKGTSQIGKWNQMPVLNKMDHAAIIGITLHTQVKDLYFAHAQLLTSLPVGAATSTTASVNSVDSTTASVAAATTASFSVATAISNLNIAAAGVQSKADIEKLCVSPANDFAKSYCATLLSQASASRRLRG